MADKFKIKEGNERPYLKVTLKRFDNEGNDQGPADLTDADTITFTMRSKKTGIVRIEKGVDVDILGDPENGDVEYHWQPDQTIIIEEDAEEKYADYFGEFDVTYSDGEEETFPNDRLGFDIRVSRRLS